MIIEIDGGRIINTPHITHITLEDNVVNYGYYIHFVNGERVFVTKSIRDYIVDVMKEKEDYYKS